MIYAYNTVTNRNVSVVGALLVAAMYNMLLVLDINTIMPSKACSAYLLFFVEVDRYPYNSSGLSFRWTVLALCVIVKHPTDGFFCMLSNN